MSLKLWGGFCPIRNGTHPENQTSESNSGLHLLLNYPLKGTFSHIIASVFQHISLPEAVPTMGAPQRGSLCISPGAEFSKGTDELCLSWGRNLKTCLVLCKKAEGMSFSWSEGKLHKTKQSWWDGCRRRLETWSWQGGSRSSHTGRETKEQLWQRGAGKEE